MPAQGELRGPRSGGGDWDTHSSDLEDSWLNPPDNAELAEFRKRLYAANRRRAQEAVSPEAWQLSLGRDDRAGSDG